MQQTNTTIIPISMAPQYRTESLIRGMDFTPLLSLSGDTLSGTPTVTATCINGVDHNPTLLSGPPSLSKNNMQVLQRITGGVSGAAYQISFSCGTAQGNNVRQDGIMWIV
jgi:hypothetical protein